MNRVRQLRKLHNLTLRELAKEVNMSYSNLGSIERGDIMLREDNARCIAKYFNVSIDYLLGIDAPKKTANAHNVKLAFIDKIDDLTDEELNDVSNYINFVKSKRK